MLKKIKLRSLLGNSWVLLLAAILVAGGLTYFMYQYLNTREQNLKAELAGKQGHGVAVVVPSQDVPAGTPLASNVFVAREVATDLVYDDMIRADSFDQLRSAKLVQPVRRGLPLRASDIDTLGNRDFSDAVPVGERAITLEIDMINSNNEMVRPGNHVDIYWVGAGNNAMDYKSTAPSEGTAIQLLLPNILILATGQDVRQRDAGEAMNNGMNSSGNGLDKSTFGSVTVQVPVAEAARLALAQRVGALRLVLRNSKDKSLDVPTYLSEEQLFGTGKRSGKSATPNVIEFISGGSQNNATKLIPVDVLNSHTKPAAAPAAPQHSAAAAPAGASTPDTTAPAKASSVYEQANAIAQQLQNLDSRAKPGRN
ncbi:Flp pilus assembly protein CpaB [Paraburkholderia bonniea]|uniref:Flp pilus assembly protein CpaB n=1 Tax=Paraburkholderia bonniea TaxID=2152891 RepID=UPI0012908BD9|nr:Flp pilus assembly protein CpaB [Paraburkholderia bonniea]WJF91762.1 Flp pilus assembly protein CpaB [Paraburkholderia bonniea]WJF95082.1 Flp pilus assembly protein CpaB [Paraburkholderia bonniea]